jgi:hypothetical protein
MLTGETPPERPQGISRSQSLFELTDANSVNFKKTQQLQWLGRLAGAYFPGGFSRLAIAMQPDVKHDLGA